MKTERLILCHNNSRPPPGEWIGEDFKHSYTKKEKQMPQKRKKMAKRRDVRKEGVLVHLVRQHKTSSKSRILPDGRDSDFQNQKKGEESECRGCQAVGVVGVT